MMNTLMDVKNLHTPSIVEETAMNGTILSVFDRLMKDRVIFVTGEVTEQMASVITAQLMYLSSKSKEEIQLYVNSPGGSVRAGLSILDAMNLSPVDINVTCFGMAASMMSVILSNGTKGKRFITLHSEVMIHQSSGGVGGNIQDAKKAMEHWDEYNEQLLEILADNCGKDTEEMRKCSERDFYINSVDSLNFGIVDGIIMPDNTIITKENISELKDTFQYRNTKLDKISLEK